MSIVGFFLVVTGVVMNVQVLRRRRTAGGSSSDVMGSPPWLISVAIIAVGVLLLSVAH